MDETPVLTSSLEDYLEAISELAEMSEEVRGGVIAERLGVKRSAVTYALHLLTEKGLVDYAPYGPIFLTPQGKREAEEVRRRHRALRIFLAKTLGVEPQKAEDFACRIEHVVDAEITARLVEFMDFLEHCPQVEQEWMARQGEKPISPPAGVILAQPGPAEEADSRSTAEELAELKSPTVFLSELPPGSSAFVTRVLGDARKRHRLTEMGFTRNATVRVVRAAPLGDPLEVEIKGYRLSLSKTDTRNIEVIPCG